MARRPSFIVLHHPAEDGIDDVRELIRPPFTDVPYDFVMDFETARVWTGRPLSKRGAHVIPDYPDALHVNNDTAIGVALEGNFDDDRPPLGPEPRHIEGLAILLADLCIRHIIWPNDVTREQLEIGKGLQGILPHRAVSRTACPGKHFMKEWPTLVGKTKFYFNQMRAER